MQKVTQKKAKCFKQIFLKILKIGNFSTLLLGIGMERLEIRALNNNFEENVPSVPCLRQNQVT